MVIVIWEELQPPSSQEVMICTLSRCLQGKLDTMLLEGGETGWGSLFSMLTEGRDEWNLEMLSKNGVDSSGENGMKFDTKLAFIFDKLSK